MKPIELQISDYIPHLRRYARVLLRRDIAAADDLVQDCVERALQRSMLWQRGTNLRAWLFTIMHNLYVNQVRRGVNGPEFVAMDEHYSDSRQSAESSAVLGDIERALDRLSADQREIILFVSIEGMKYHEVAGILDIPEGTVMSRLARARQQLRDSLAIDKLQTLRRVK
ncbi:MAG: sigma-70 family RNA polymerase sigma factor [Gammaproteobacteria bacterium]|nr:sigma-70 family RNA polymerase sigma factor [Gammaproteobacteria bacterium]